MERPSRWANHAAMLNGGEPAEYLGEAWLLGKSGMSADRAVARILQAEQNDAKTNGGLNEPIDPDLIDAEKDLATQVMANAYRADIRRELGRALLAIGWRYHRILVERFGLVAGREDDDKTCAQIAPDFNLTAGTIRDIELRALRRLKHPSRSRRLRSLMGADAPHIVELRSRYLEKIDRSITWPEWDRQVAAAGGDPQESLWPWHGCAITQMVQAAGKLPRPRDLVEFRRKRQEECKKRDFHINLGDVVIEWRQGRGYLVADKVTYPAGGIYYVNEVFREGRRLGVTGCFSVPRLPETIINGLLGRQLADVVGHWTIGRNMEIIGAWGSEDRTYIKVLSVTAPLGHGAGKYLHPLDLAVY